MKSKEDPIPVPKELLEVEVLREATCLTEQFRGIQQISDRKHVKALFYWSIQYSRIRKNVRGCIKRIKDAQDTEESILEEVLEHRGVDPLVALHEFLEVFDKRPDESQVVVFLEPYLEQALDTEHLQVLVNLVNLFVATPNEKIERYLWRIVTEHDSKDVVSVAAIALVRVCSTDIYSKLDIADSYQRCSLLYGCAVVFDDDVLESSCEGVGSAWSDLLMQEFSSYAQIQSNDLQVLSLKGIKCMLDRPNPERFAEKALTVVFDAWEKVSISKKIRGMITVLFRSIVPLIPDKAVLLQRILDMPKHRRGRYKAIDALLPHLSHEEFPARSILFDLTAEIGEFGHNHAAMSDLWVSIVSRERKSIAEERNHEVWHSIWTPSVAKGLLHPSQSYRKHVSAFLLTRLCDLGEKRGNREDGATCFSTLLQEIARVHREQQCRSSVSIHRETFADRVLWAKLEVIRVAKSSGVIEIESPFARVMAEVLTFQDILDACSHFSSTIREVAMQMMVVYFEACRGTGEDSLSLVRRVIDVWQRSLPNACKYDGRHYISSIVKTIFAWIDSLLITDDESISEELRAFVLEFLCENLLLRLAYPGASHASQTFALGLLEGLLSTLSPECPQARYYFLYSDASQQRGRGNELRSAWLDSIIRDRVFDHVMHSCVSLLHSIWDNIRAHAFKLAKALVWLLHKHKLNDSNPLATMERSELIFEIASSTRQRDSDIGSHLLAFGLMCQRNSLEENIRSLIGKIEENLERILRDVPSTLDADTISVSVGLRKVPVSHGMIQAIRMTILSSSEVDREWRSNSERMFRVFLSALRVSLAMVADVPVGEKVAGLQDDTNANYDLAEFRKQIISSNKINPGAIGANGIFSSIENLTEKESTERRFSQQLVITAWLMLKESTEALSVLVQGLPDVSVNVVEEIGKLLISTMTSLKHTGAAYAAHSALQSVVECCCERQYSSSTLDIWLRRLFDEVSNDGGVRDSILRRSTGYGLGFLSILRPICKAQNLMPEGYKALERLLIYALPSLDCIERSGFIRRPGDVSKFFSFLPSNEVERGISVDYNQSTKIHALNILRLFVLDKQVTKLSARIIGDCFAMAAIGFTDTSWAIRNSSTMLFAACMLRAVDADRNASKSQTQGSRAVSLSELFRLYPCLPQLFGGLLAANQNLVLDSSSFGSLPPVFPVLLVLARVEPLSNSEEDLSGFLNDIRPLLNSLLAHQHISVRKMSARALVNTCQIESHFAAIARDTRAALEYVVSNSGVNWNGIHGILLAFKEMASKDVTRDEALRRIVVSDLQRLLSSPDIKDIIPSLCLYTGYQILDTALGENVTSNENTVLSRLEDFDAPGSSELRMALSTHIANVEQSSLWNTSALFSHSNFDTVLHGTKAVKRNLYSIFENEDLTTISTSSVMHLASCFVNTIRNSLSSPKDVDEPTLRRSSRCLLECLDFLSDRDALLDFADKAAIVGEEIMKWIERANRYNEKTQVYGNALELLAYRTPSSDHSTEIIRRIRAVNDPSVHWRIRYSGAKALREFMIEESIDAKIAYLEFLQDNDIDVRYIAARRVEKLCGRMGLAQTPESVLRQAFRWFSQDAEFCRRAISTVIDSLELSFNEITKRLDKYFCLSTENGDDDDAVFQEEEQNVYRERALFDQLVFESVVDRKGVSLLHDHSAKVGSYFRETVRLLHQMKSIHGNNILVDQTHSESVFLPLHTVIVASMLCVADTVDGDTVETVVQLCTTSSSMHPAIRKAFEMWRSVALDKSQSTSAARSCLFLL